MKNYRAIERGASILGLTGTARLMADANVEAVRGDGELIANGAEGTGSVMPANAGS